MPDFAGKFCRSLYQFMQLCKNGRTLRFTQERSRILLESRLECFSIRGFEKDQILGRYFGAVLSDGIVDAVFFCITDLIGLGLGVVMIVAFNAQYRFVASRTYATMPNVHYTIQYIPMAIAGAFIALKSLEMLVGHIAAKKGGKAA